jgi:hypothetical protein
VTTPGIDSPATRGPTTAEIYLLHGSTDDSIRAAVGSGFERLDHELGRDQLWSAHVEPNSVTLLLQVPKLSAPYRRAATQFPCATPIPTTPARYCRHHDDTPFFRASDTHGHTIGLHSRPLPPILAVTSS